LKQIFIVIILVCCITTVNGQKSKVLNLPNHDDRAIHFGFCLGVNSMSFVVRPNYQSYAKDSLLADVGKPEMGFHIQVVSNYRLGEYFDLRFLPGVAFGQRQLNFYKNNQLYSDKHKLESNFLEFPLLLKYKAKRYNNFRPYIITGGNLRYDLAKTFSEDDKVYIDLKNLDLYYEAGTGVDLYLPYFKMSIELKISYGFFNALKTRSTTNPEFENAIDKLNSKIWLLSFHFE
jgi:Outer membrane protein beta-barrel domain